MQRLLSTGSLLLMIWLLSGCSTMKPEDYADSTPVFDLFSYFDGQTKAWGMFQDRFGQVRRRFTVDIDGVQKDDVLTLTELFEYSDGETETRIWTIQRLDQHHYEGQADDVVGIATGKAYGNALNWRYDLLLNVDEKQWRVSFNDWMFLHDDNVLINRAKVSKFGFTIGEVTLFFQKP